MENILDIHILHCGERFPLVHRCSRMMPEWANVWIVPGKLNELSASRKFGYSLGDAPFVSFADPDDVYYAEGFEAGVAGLLAHPECSFAFTRETIDGEPDVDRWEFDQVKQSPFFHGVIVIRRELCMRVNADMPIFQRCHETGHRLRLLLDYGPALFCPVVGRDWKKHANQTHRHATVSDSQNHGHLYATRKKQMRRKELVCLTTTVKF